MSAITRSHTKRSDGLQKKDSLKEVSNTSKF